MIGILGSVANLATTFIDSKAKIKQAEAETKMKLATGEITWEQSAIEASKNSWKDELWTVVFVIILGANFFPAFQEPMRQGFENLENCPDWVAWGMYASIAASFGIRGIKGFKK